jgi:CRISPR-associated protein Cas5h
VKEILIFDLKGRLAHFRKYFTNSSSLSYTFPPRTVITGLVAGLLGEERDTYYEKLNDSYCKIALTLRTPVRKMMQTMNYINAKNYSANVLLSDNPNFGHVQIPLEVICPVDDAEIIYRIYISCESVHQKLKARLENNLFVYPPYLGITEFLGEIEYISEGTINEIPFEKPVKLNSVCRKNAIVDRGLKFEDADAQYLFEKMPADFSGKREVTRYEEYIFEKNGKTIVASLKEPAYHASYSGNSENIIFM